MPAPIAISVQEKDDTKAHLLIFGNSEDTPYPNIVSYKATKEGSVKDVLGLGQFGTVGQQIDYSSTQLDIATLREFVRIAGEVRGHQNGEAIKALFKFNVNQAIAAALGAGPDAVGNVMAAMLAAGGTLNINLPFVDYPLNAFVSRLDVKEIPGTTDRYSYDIQFTVVQSNWGQSNSPLPNFPVGPSKP